MFLLQLEQSLNQGKQDAYMAKLEIWVNENLETLYANKYPEMKNSKFSKIGTDKDKTKFKM